MNSTEKKEILAIKFFNDVIIPVSESIRKSEKSFFPLYGDGSLESYYSKPIHKFLNQNDFELKAAESLEDFFTEIKEFWKKEGNKELAEITTKLFQLAKKLSHGEIQEEDVSPFIYVMF